ncbi:MAG: class II poly(R)-hydroxyalkanoic acid synthase [Micrococcales bacterium]|nr:MAG: class II poly(R)-hydroxyalkanoic acid synthase [Micrococcales bacterium]PIE27749.1 MAG: class II poly(R)-hydroxyalkanoic acid synthase [Micrococcales bacterium]
MASSEAKEAKPEADAPATPDESVSTEEPAPESAHAHDEPEFGSPEAHFMLHDLAHRAAELAGGVGVGPSPFVGYGPRDAAGGLLTLGRYSIRKPLALIEAAPRAATQLARIGTGRSEVAPEKSDRRFRDPAWQERRLYKALMQLYLYVGQELDELIEGLELSELDTERVEFVVGLVREAVAPTNNILTNPAALRRARETKGRSLAKGFGHLVHDVRHNHGMPSQVNRKPYKVGVNMAVTPGAVVFRNDVCELIQYTPQTATVGSRPLVVVPPQVNKYYALDLAPGRSGYEYLVSQGIQLFGISWRNPTAKERNWSFDTYSEAALEAIDVARDISRSPDVNIMGGCAGGMQAMMLASLDAQREDKAINSVSLLVTLLDNVVDAEILMFASPRTVKLAKLQSSLVGYLDGWRMAQVFAWLRPNELVWNYWVNNYLMGQDPPSFDILAWNADTTRLPAKLHHQLLDVVAENQLAEPGKLEVLGTPFDISKVTVDCYVAAGSTDHITPWVGCYSTTQMVGGKAQFVLPASGHVQTLIADTSNTRSHYYTNPETPATPQEWREGATDNQGSWWEHWAVWLNERSGTRKKARKTLGNKRYQPMEAAPGTYILG